MPRREQWLTAAKRAFEAIEGASSAAAPGGGPSCRSGKVNSGHLIDLLRQRLPCAEVDYAVEDALLEAGAVGAPAACDVHPAPSTECQRGSFCRNSDRCSPVERRNYFC